MSFEYLERIEKERTERSGTLELTNLGLETIPPEVNTLTWLTTLKLDGNAIQRIEHLDQLVSLKTLWLSYNKITKMSGLENLQSLDRLFLMNNFISEIEGLERLANLGYIDLQNNQIQQISGLEHCRNLYGINLGGNNITKIEHLQSLTELNSLRLGENQISVIENLEGLTKLVFLILNNNRIAKIQGLKDQVNLVELNLARNYIHTIENLEHMEKLDSIDLEGNSIKDLTPLRFHPKLKKVGFSNTNVHDIGILEDMQELETVYFSQCKLSSLDALANKPHLKRVVLSNTGIPNLLPLLKNIEAGLPVKWVYGFEDYTDGIYIKDNSQLDIPKEIIAQGNEAILRFYSLRQAPKTDPSLEEIQLYEAKLIIVGEGRVGKSSLRVKLLDKDAPLPASDERTRGIDIADYKFPMSSNKEFNAHIWDFGGQNIQFALHRFFMTENSLYVLMTESRQERDKNFDYWFQNIELFGGKDSPIIVVMNLTNGERGANIDIASYTTVFKNIKYAQVLEVNLLNPEQDNGLQKLTRILQQELEQLPHIQKPIFRCWLDVRGALMKEAQTRNYIPIERFYELCSEMKVEDKDVELVGRYLHNLGIVLWYHDKEFLKNKMILKPLWAINAIYKVIDDKDIQNRKGIFLQEDKDRLWSDADYKFAKDELTSLLKVFKICFQRQNHDAYIIPALMDAVAPEETKDWNQQPSKKVIFHFTFMPKGLVNQLTADLYKHITDELKHVWAYGILLHYADDRNTEALVVENSYKRDIQIQVKGLYASQFIGVIIQALKSIIDTYMGLSYRMQIPCVCSTCATLAEPQIYTEAELFEKLKEEKLQVYCNKLDEKIDIKPILESIGIHHPLFLRRSGPPDVLTPSATNGKSKKLRVFLSYSHAQTAYFKIFKDDLNTYLKIPGLEIEIFQDFEIPVGARWDEYLQDKVANCDVMILLVSQEFMNSQYISEKEFGAAIRQQKMLISPVYFAPCNFSDEKELSALQFYKPNGDEFEQAQKGLEFSYIDLVKFRENDGMANPNANRAHYMKKYTDKLRTRIEQLIESGALTLS